MNQTKENQKQPPRCFLQYAFTVPDFFVILEKDQLICELKSQAAPLPAKASEARLKENYE